MVWALFNCRESDQLTGLLAWLKSKHCKGYDWIQHVAEHASGNLEKASTGYLNALNDENATNMDEFTKDFIQKQLTDCLYHTHTGRWSEVTNIITSSTYSQKHLECMEAIYQNAMKQSSGMETEDFANSLLGMTEWTNDTRNNELSKRLETFSCYDVIRDIHESCLMRSLSNRIDRNSSWFEPVKKCIQQGLRNQIVQCYNPGSGQYLLNDLILLNHVTQKIEVDDNISVRSNGNIITSDLLNKTFCWSLILDKSTGEHLPHLLLTMATKARLENNFNYSQSLLDQFFKLKNIDKPLTKIVQELKLNQFRVDYGDLDIISGLEELVKCMYGQNNSTFDALELGSACCVQVIQKRSESMPSTTLPCSILNMLLCMSDWLSTNRLHNSNLTHGMQFKKLQSLLPDTDFCSYSDISKSSILPTSEYAVGKLLNASTLCKDNSGEAWFSFGNWCYRWGKKLMEASSDQAVMKELKLTHRNIVSVHDILASDCNDVVKNQVIDVINAHMTVKDDNVDDDVYIDNAQNASEVLEHELKNVCNISSEQINAIISIWRQAQKGVYGFYEQATRAYFKYLAIQSDTVLAKKSMSNTSETEDCTYVTTTLRLLRLIVKHAAGLQVFVFMIVY